MNSDAIKSELLGLEKQFWQAMKDGDSEVATSMSDEECILASPSGASSIDRKTLGEMLNTEMYYIHEFKIDEGSIKVKVINDDVAVIAYRVTEKLTVDDKPVELDAAETSVWRRLNGKWLCVVHTESLIGDPFGRDRVSEMEKSA